MPTLKQDAQQQSQKAQKRSKRNVILVIIVIILLVILLLLLKSCSWKVSIPNKSWTTQITAKSNIKTPDYSIKDFMAEIITDKWEAEWWNYYYVDSIENGAEVKQWPTTDTENAMTANYTIKNLSQNNIDFLSISSAKVIVNDNEEYEWTVFITNIWQLDADGYEARSLKSIPLKPGEETKIWMVANIPNSLARSNDKLGLQFTIKGDLYTVDLREEMEVFDG